MLLIWLVSASLTYRLAEVLSKEKRLRDMRSPLGKLATKKKEESAQKNTTRFNPF